MIQKEIKVNDIFYSSWGYEQTNIDYYKVKKVMNNMIELVAIESKIDYENSTEYTDAVMPYPANEGKRIFRRKVKYNSDRPSVNISPFQSASKWDGQPKAQTNPNYGH